MKKASSSEAVSHSLQRAPAAGRVPEEDAMWRDSKAEGSTEEGEGLGLDTIEQRMRERVRTTIEAIVEEELEAALGAKRGARVGEQRQGYRHGGRERTLTTSLGPTTLRVPRARLQGAEGKPQGWRSRVLPRYQRRTQRVDEAILGVNFRGQYTSRG